MGRYFRHTLRASWQSFVFRGLLPFLGGVMLTLALVKSAIDMADREYGFTVLFDIGGAFVLGVGGLLLGVVLMTLWYVTQASRPFFNGETLNRDTPVLVHEDDHP